MPITIHVNGSSNSLAHKGCNGFAKNTPPDVCKTPSPAGPVPIPYPVIVSMANFLDKGTKTIKADGNMAANKGSELSRCTGDEPGVAGGVVSSTNMKEAKWILYSMNVKLEGKNACRLSDKLTMNHGNTACLAGWIELPVIKGNTPEEKIACAIYCCDTAVRYNQSPRSRPKSKDCQRLGTRKHSCVHNALKNMQPPDPNIMSSPRFPGKGPPALGTTYQGGGAKGMKALLRLAKKLGHKKKLGKYVTPDTVYKDSNGNYNVIDAKFPCEPDPKKRINLKKTAMPSPAPSKSMYTYKETDIYPELKVGTQKIKDTKAVTPQDADGMRHPDCDPCEVPP